jgi:hypothetical protein
MDRSTVAAYHRALTLIRGGYGPLEASPALRPYGAARTRCVFLAAIPLWGGNCRLSHSNAGANYA